VVSFSDNVTRIYVITVQTKLKPEFDMSKVVTMSITWTLTVQEYLNTVFEVPLVNIRKEKV
jgi:hypothetical protein